MSGMAEVLAMPRERAVGPVVFFSLILQYGP